MAKQERKIIPNIGKTTRRWEQSGTAALGIKHTALWKEIWWHLVKSGMNVFYNPRIPPAKEYAQMISPMSSLKDTHNEVNWDTVCGITYRS